MLCLVKFSRVCNTLLHKPRCTPWHVYETIKYLNFNLFYFCSPVCQARGTPLKDAGRAENSDLLLNVLKFSPKKKIAPVNYTRLLLKVVTVYLSQCCRRVKIFCTELVTVDAVEVKQSLCEVHPQVEIPEKWTQEPPCFAITTGVRLRSHTKNFTGFPNPAVSHKL